ncbi:hypothetical protein [Sphingomonas sp. PB4P5]|uniref:hypothetical protein n=1 Tax=Parasphingomonas puruogangriensis TaxID=3096155 RepID=UPI002FC86B64
MAIKSAPARPSPARRRRPCYHEVQPGGTSRGHAARDQKMRGEPRDLGGLGWIGLVIVALVLADTLAWHGYYANRLWIALDGQGTATRHWADNLWD